MGWMMFRIFAAASCLLVASIIGTGPTAAGTDFFAGKTITYIVATKAGGGYDTMGRLVAKYLEKHLVGSNVVVKNVPGAGHLIGAKTIYAANADGLTIGTFNTGLIYSQLTNQTDSELDLSKMSWIGKAAIESRVLVVSAGSDLRNIDDFKNPNRKIKMAVSGKGTASDIDTLMLAKAFGLNVQVIPGFEGTEAEMSILRGEIDAYVGSGSSLKPFVDNGHGRILLEVGGAPDSTITQASDLAKTEQSKSIIGLIEAQSQLARLTAGPKGIPEDRLQTLREAYTKALADPELLVEAEKFGLPIAPASGEVVAEHIRAALDQSPDNIALLKASMKDE
jgi:tripartite-type tricarboxylate transporter receptor subunit TctC